MITVIKQGSTKELIQEIWDRLFAEKHRKGVNARKFCGVLKLQEDPLVIQEKLRDEWG